MALFFITPALAKAPNVVVSLKPVHGLIAGVMAGVGEPGLLLAAVADPHSHALLPSQARSLASAEVVFWVGAKLERYLQRPLSNIAAKAQIVTLLDNPELRILPARRSGIWRPHDHEAGGEDHEAGGDHDSDPHFWLDPRNAQAIVRQAVMVLRKVDPDNGHLYSQNGDGMLYGLSVLEADLHRLLAPVRTLPYLVLHDAYQYFEARFRTNGVGAIAISPDRKPGARRIAAIRQRLRQGNVRCLFQEAEFNSNIVATLTEGSDIRVATLDPIGLRVRPGLGAYGQVLRQLAGALENCLSYSLGP
ncbi:MAG: zinc ABC transporter solute-binding protein [Rhodospirillaceae bacterium]|nr:zinc ABC transporter solute-binding protein [Rhodospirillaceae bacterium]MBT5190901.1 zinc ABC transporter solute-binding protein [Rhodospirillaceae bacterium]MBT5898758.1 zinc ABC transporter solute-binding protein [Rhodospirillaceae bacterium]MBT6426554.1 zinc ABC transporter solute-binding protein [Rhodospirillaceae bacterium]MBT7758508.1 zinc ABC transporter solute-binding protein [Rhodospirillaceae bacterium]